MRAKQVVRRTGSAEGRKRSSNRRQQVRAAAERSRVQPQAVAGVPLRVIANRPTVRPAAAGRLYATTALCGILGAGLLATVWSAPVRAQTLPTGGTVVQGNATISQSGNQLDINQSTQKGIINWQSFSIGADAHVRFQQPNASSITLNRVTGGDASQILGRLTANGQVMLINPNGILFGAGAKIDVAGLVATTSNISDSDFMSGNYKFAAAPNASGAVVNEGEITIRDGGLAALVAPTVRNSGTIVANVGRVALAAGETFTLDFYGDQLVQFAVPTSSSSGTVSVENGGTIRADGGKVLLSAATAKGVVDGVINMDGIVEARSVGVKNGVIVLDGGEAGTVNVAGTLDASGRNAGETGGEVKVLGDQVALAGTAALDASGDAGGGTVLVGGNYQGKGPERNATRTTIAAGATLKADA
ncbi:MAG TPA: filamentous hemagglutinin N-terminal domain-containing protein, partial [Alphaproteobacteria bacterium]